MTTSQFLEAALKRASTNLAFTPFEDHETPNAHNHPVGEKVRISYDFAVQVKYFEMRLKGESHNMAEMLATRSFAGIRTDAIFNEGRFSGESRGHCTAHETWLRQQAEKHGVNTAGKYYITAKYPDDITVILAGGYPEIRGGTKWIGTDGWVWVDRGNAFESSNKALEDTRSLPEAQRKVKLINTGGHYRNFIDCVKSRKPTVTPVEVAHHSTIPGHLGLISMLVGRKLTWDAAKEVILGDPEATALLSRPYRDPWKLPAV